MNRFNPFANSVQTIGKSLTDRPDLRVIFRNLPDGAGAMYCFKDPPVVETATIILPMLDTTKLNAAQKKLWIALLCHEVLHHDRSSIESNDKAKEKGQLIADLANCLEDARIEIDKSKRWVSPGAYEDLFHYRMEKLREMQASPEAGETNPWGRLFQVFKYYLPHYGQVPIPEGMEDYFDIGMKIIGEDDRFYKAADLGPEGSIVTAELAIEIAAAWQERRDKDFEEEDQDESEEEENEEDEQDDEDAGEDAEENDSGTDADSDDDSSADADSGGDDDRGDGTESGNAEDEPADDQLSEDTDGASGETDSDTGRSDSEAASGDSSDTSEDGDEQDENRGAPDSGGEKDPDERDGVSPDPEVNKNEENSKSEKGKNDEEHGTDTDGTEQSDDESSESGSSGDDSPDPSDDVPGDDGNRAEPSDMDTDDEEGLSHREDDEPEREGKEETGPVEPDERGDRGEDGELESDGESGPKGEGGDNECNAPSQGAGTVSSTGADDRPQDIGQEYENAQNGNGFMPTDTMGAEVAALVQIVGPPKDEDGDEDMGDWTPNETIEVIDNLIRQTPDWEGHVYIPYNKKDREIVPKPDPEAYRFILGGIGAKKENMRRELTRILAQESNVIIERGLRSGQMDPHLFHKVVKGSRRVKSQTTPAHFIDTAVTLLLDLSGSMMGERVIVAAQIGSLFGEAMFPIQQLSFEIQGYNSSPLTTQEEHDAKKDGFVRTEIVNYWMFKKFEEAWPKARNRLGACLSTLHDEKPETGGATGGCNVDHENLILAASRLWERKEKNKVMIVVCDGAPSGYNGTYGGLLETRLVEAVQEVKKSGIKVFCFGIMSPRVQRFYAPDFKLIDNINELDAAAMQKLGSYLLKGHR
jgi:hypothetical protein